MSRKLRIRILEDPFELPDGGSLLHALQLYGVARDLPDYGFTRFCWNAKCKQCVLELTCDGRTRRDFACQTDTCDGLEVHTLPEVLMWKPKSRCAK